MHLFAKDITRTRSADLESQARKYNTLSPNVLHSPNCSNAGVPVRGHLFFFFVDCALPITAHFLRKASSCKPSLFLRKLEPVSPTTGMSNMSRASWEEIRNKDVCIDLIFYQISKQSRITSYTFPKNPSQIAKNSQYQTLNHPYKVYTNSGFSLSVRSNHS